MDTPAQAPLFKVSSSPHIREGSTVRSVMLWVVVAMLPALGSSYVYFGWRALALTLVSVAAAVATEWLIASLTKKPSTVGDLSAVVTGMLVAYNVPAGLPFWMVALGSVFAIGVAKMVFGGLGHNFINPALAGRALLMASYPAAMTTWVAPSGGFIGGVDGTSGATPLAFIKDAVASGALDIASLKAALPSLLTGSVGGCVGETSAIALIAGALLMLYKKIISIDIPLTYIGTVFVLFLLFGGGGSALSEGALIVATYHVLAGGLLLGALFMATDMVTSPITTRGKIVFGAGCGFLTFFIRKFGGYPEGVSYSILIMNCLVPLIDRYMRPRRYGEVKKRA